MHDYWYNQGIADNEQNFGYQLHKHKTSNNGWDRAMKNATIHPVIPQTQIDTIVKRNYKRKTKNIIKRTETTSAEYWRLKKSKPRKLSIQAQLEKPTTKQPQKTEEAAGEMSKRQ